MPSIFPRAEVPALQAHREIRPNLTPRVKHDKDADARLSVSIHSQEACMKLTGRTALVTGGSRGIGRAIALALAEEGADVAVNYVSSEPAARDVVAQIAKTGRRGLLAQADVSDFPDTFRMAQDVIREFGHLDILVNNAGVNSDKTFVKMDHSSWRKVLSINLDGVFNCTKVFVDQMLKQNYGRVVNITSVIGQIGNFGQANYAASKAGVAAFTKSLAKELAGKGVTVNAVAPGFIETEMVESIPDKVKNRLLDQIPLKRFGSAEEVARAVVYIVSSDGDYITGAEVSINGGLLM
jgi:3-oxoacyl-[acyl-carrier protein] reductase